MKTETFGTNLEPNHSDPVRGDVRPGDDVRDPGCGGPGEALRESEARYRMLFENSPVAIREEDFSDVKAFFDELRARGVADIESHFSEHPEDIRQCAGMVRIVDVNRAALALYGAGTKEELLVGIANTFTPESLEVFRRELVCLWNGGTEMTADTTVRTLAGGIRQVTVCFSVGAGCGRTRCEALVSLVDITERKRAENQQRFLETLLESTEAGIVACDADGVLTLFNRKTKELHGLPQTPIPADRWAEHYDLFMADGKTPMRKEDVPLFRALQGEDVVNAEMMIIPRGGEAKVLLASGRPILDKAGRKIGAVVALHDITRRKRIEETLRQSEERYRNVVENIGIGVTMISPKMEILAQNACMRKWFPNVDVSRRPICYENFINPPRSSLCVNCPTFQTLRDGEVHDAIIETPSGNRTLYFRVLSSPIKDRDGRVVAATEMVEDVTQSHTLQEELRQYRERLEEAIQERTAELRKVNAQLRSELAERQRVEASRRESEMTLMEAQQLAHIGSWTLDLVTNQLHWSDEIFRIFGIDKTRFGASYEAFLEAVHPDDREKVNRAYTESVQNRTQYEIEHRLLLPDGHVKHVHERCKTIYDTEGRPLRSMGTVQDITARKLVEEGMRSLNQELETRVGERTADLQIKTDELQRNQRALMNIIDDLNEKSVALEAANKELESFSYSVSHDLRAPLRSIDGFSRALLEDYADKLDDEGKENLRTVRAASQRMGQLIDDMLRLSHINRSEMRYSDVNLSDMAGQIVSALKLAEPGRQAEFIIEPGCMVKGDPTLLRTAMENVLGNAWKYTGKVPAAKIEFGTTNTADGRTFFVRDNGCGFEMKYAGKLFGAFQRLHTPAEFPGTGIGLASVHRVIRRHGGRVWIEGKVDAGTTLFFTLPKR